MDKAGIDAAHGGIERQHQEWQQNIDHADSHAALIVEEFHRPRHDAERLQPSVQDAAISCITIHA